NDFSARRVAAHDITQAVFDRREETGSDLPIGGETYARARAAEGFGDGRDDADLACCAVGEAPTRRGLSTTPHVCGHKRETFFDARAYLAPRDDRLTRPLVPRIKR